MWAQEAQKPARIPAIEPHRALGSALPLQGRNKHAPCMPMVHQDIVEVRSNTNAPTRKTRVSRKVRQACEAIVYDGLKRDEAAKLVGMTDNGLYVAMRKPEIKALLNTLKEDFRTQESWRKVRNISTLGDSAKSEAVRLDASKWIAGLDGYAPIQKSQVDHTHKHDIPGLNITFNMGGQAAPAIEGECSEVIGNQHAENGKPNNNSEIPTPVPHPALRNEQK